VEWLAELWEFASGALAGAWRNLAGWARWMWEDLYQQLSYVLVFLVAALVRAAGKTVQSGQTGLKFSFGRATRVAGPGFYPLIPFLQVMRIVATRDRTLDLPEQRVTTQDGLVYDVDANLVFRVVDVRKALIEIDDLDRGMHQVLGLSVQEVLRQRARGELHVSSDLDQVLARALAERLAPWGVEVRRAGFTSITPSDRTLRVTQLVAATDERARLYAALSASGAPPGAALALLGTQLFPVPRAHQLRRLALAQRRARRVRAALAEAATPIDHRRLPLSLRLSYTERAYLGERFAGKDSNLLFPIKTKKKPDAKVAEEKAGAENAKPA
jgi:regulator of protease activity HflC (stomatin/prohibitin superfamily)